MLKTSVAQAKQESASRGDVELDEGHRRDLVRALTEAWRAASALRETDLAVVLHAMRETAMRGDRAILTEKDDRRVVEWARRALETKHTVSRVAVRVNERTCVWVERRIGDEGTIGGLVALGLALPWAEAETDCARVFAGHASAGGLFGPSAKGTPWEIERGVVREVTEGIWRRRDDLSAGAFVRASLRALGFSSQKADDAVRYVTKGRPRKTVRTSGMR